MIPILVLVFVVLVLIHFVYESLISPLLYEKSLYRLFALRDELFHLKIDSSSRDEGEAIEVVKESLDGMIYVSRRLTLRTVVSYLNHDSRDGSIDREISRRKQVLRDCPDERVIQIQMEGARVTFQMLLVNSFGSFVYLIPIVLLVLIYKSIRSLVSDIAARGEESLRGSLAFNYG